MTDELRANELRALADQLEAEAALLDAADPANTVPGAKPSQGTGRLGCS